MRRSAAFHAPWVAGPTTEEAYDVWLRRQGTAEFEGFLILRTADDELVGFGNLSQIIRGPLQSAFLGFAGVAGHERRGYMREGLGLVIDNAFGPLRLHRIEANVQPQNRASRSLIESLGFVLEGFSERYLKVEDEWKDHERWAIREEIWSRIRVGP